MRVTTSMLASNFLTNINRNASRMEKTMQQLSSGQVMSRPSDDPSSLSKLMTLKRSLNQAEQYGRNIDSAEGWLNVTDTAYGQINDILHRVAELATAGASGTFNESDRAGMAGEIDQLMKEILQIANTSYDGKYIFATNNITQKPFNDDYYLAEFSVEDDIREVEIAPNVTMEIQNNGENLFINSGIFEKLQQLSTDIKDGYLDEVSNALDDVNGLRDFFLNQRVAVGVKSLRLETARARYEEEIINLSTMISKVGDTDIAEAMTNYKIQETVYQAALSSGAKIMQISLLDYLR